MEAERSLFAAHLVDALNGVAPGDGGPGAVEDEVVLSLNGEVTIACVVMPSALLAALIAVRQRAVRPVLRLMSTANSAAGCQIRHVEHQSRPVARSAW